MRVQNITEDGKITKANEDTQTKEQQTTIIVHQLEETTETHYPQALGVVTKRRTSNSHSQGLEET